ncbi:MAG TPA: hypothetical protein VFF65_04915 [Phycisphaerales bacterium]|nr:hypothetical protein [Phycisphaerales bacterium]
MNTNKNDRSSKPDSNPANRDPITGAPGAHPVSTGAGAAAGGVTGGAVGAIGGPVGAAVGATVGAVAGGLAGKAAGEAIDPTEEEGYWRSNFKSRPYARDYGSYEEVAPAYRYGWESAASRKWNSFDEAEGSLSKNWDKAKGKTELTWEKAKVAVKDAWDRVVPGRGR